MTMLTHAFARWLTHWTASLFLMMTAALLAQPRPAPRADGERIVCFGDSITHGGSYILYAQLFSDLRRPGSGITFLNAGISGDSAGGGLGRWSHDVAPMNPDRVLVMFGMNDVGRNNYASTQPTDRQQAARKRSLENYEKNQRRLAEMLLQAGKTPILITPSPYDQYGTAPTAPNLVACNDPGLADCAAIVRRLAAEKNLATIEFHRPMTSLLQSHPEQKLCGNDRVHPGNEGHLLMAALLLQAFQADATVADVTLDASRASVTAVRNATVSDLRRQGRGLAFRYAPHALPFPISSEYRKVDAIFPLTDTLNREFLRIPGLPDGTYVLKANGKRLADVTAAQLSAGINLALLDTPSQAKAKEADRLMREMRPIVSQLRNIPYMNRTVRRRKGNPDDQADSFRVLDEWIAEREKAKDAHLNYYRWVVRSYKEQRPKLAEREARVAELRRQMAAIRPDAFEIAVE